MKYLYLVCEEVNFLYCHWGLLSLSCVCTFFGIDFTLLSIVSFLNVIYFKENTNLILVFDIKKVKTADRKSISVTFVKQVRYKQ